MIEDNDSWKFNTLLIINFSFASTSSDSTCTNPNLYLPNSITQNGHSPIVIDKWPEGPQKAALFNKVSRSLSPRERRKRYSLLESPSRYLITFSLLFKIHTILDIPQFK